MQEKQAKLKLVEGHYSKDQILSPKAGANRRLMLPQIEDQHLMTAENAIDQDIKETIEQRHPKTATRLPPA